MDRAALINAQAQRLAADFALYPIVAGEIEFYLHGSERFPALPALWEEIETFCESQGIGIFKIEKERGREQHEIALVPVASPVKAARDIDVLRAIVTDISAKHGLRADFSSKPLADQPGSGLHIHVHLMGAKGHNVFYKDDEKISEELLFSIGGLLAWLPDCMPVFAPAEKSYARFAQAEEHTPTTVSWGANNRTVAVRLPDKPHDQKHIEHRVSGADADSARVIAVILAAMHCGIKNQIEPGPQIYGDAALAIYNLPKLPLSLQEAMAKMHASALVPDYFNVPDLLPTL